MLELTPKTKRPNGCPCCEPVVYPGRRVLPLSDVAQPTLSHHLRKLRGSWTSAWLR